MEANRDRCKHGTVHYHEIHSGCCCFQIVSDGCDAVGAALDHSLVPVLHGDCVLDHTLECTVLGYESHHQFFLIQNKIKHFSDAVIQIFFFEILKIN